MIYLYYQVNDDELTIFRRREIGLLKTMSKRSNQTIVMITHNEEIAQMTYRVIRIEDGKIVKKTFK